MQKSGPSIDLTGIIVPLKAWISSPVKRIVSWLVLLQTGSGTWAWCLDRKLSARSVLVLLFYIYFICLTDHWIVDNLRNKTFFSSLCLIQLKQIYTSRFIAWVHLLHCFALKDCQSGNGRCRWSASKVLSISLKMGTDVCHYPYW